MAAVDMAMTAILHEAKKLRQGGPTQCGLDVLENDINVRKEGGRVGWEGVACGVEEEEGGEEHCFCRARGMHGWWGW